jgi:hypothetical protein
VIALVLLSGFFAALVAYGVYCSVRAWLCGRRERKAIAREMLDWNAYYLTEVEPDTYEGRTRHV